MPPVWPKSATADHGHIKAAGRDQWEQALAKSCRQRLRWNAYRLSSREETQVEHFARMQHRVGQRGSSSPRHATQQQLPSAKPPSGNRECVRRAGIDDVPNFSRRKCPPSRFLRMRSITRNGGGEALAGSPESKALRQKIGDVAFRVALVALIKHDRLRPEFINDLPASATRRAGHVLRVGYCDGEISSFGPFAAPPKRSPCARHSSSFHKKNFRHCIPQKFRLWK